VKSCKVCIAATCASLGATCGHWDDGCGGSLSCGTCSPGQVCDHTSKSCRACTASTCASLGATCGQWSDGCGGTTGSCGTCSPGQVCSDNTKTCQICTPRTCSSLGATCGTWNDGCGGSTGNCGSCAPGLVCDNSSKICKTPTGGGGGGGSDGGGGSGGGTGCQTCASLGATCGSWSDSCGGTLTCGSCSPGQVCDNTVKQCKTCTPTTTCLDLPCGVCAIDSCGTNVCSCQANCGTH
jgi:hypothetical protein